MRALVVVALTLLVSGCAGLWMPLAERAGMQAREGGFQPVAAVEGPIKAWLRVSPDARADAPLTVYIEGDGAQWRGRYRPPADPTPENALTLRLALRDPGARVAYLGRPCQYLDKDALALCPPAYWIGGRYGEAALRIVDGAIDRLKQAVAAASLHLVGFSGGGAMAALIAARREDVACVVTMASPLDTEAWTSALGLSPLAESLNPLDFALRLRWVPQVHFSAEGDETVPPATLKRVIEALPDARVEVVKHMDHECCWVPNWPMLRARTCLAGQ